MYLDPGFGSLIVQSVIAAIAAVGVVWFSTKKRIKGWFTPKKHEPDKLEEQDERPE